jgi:hypothetical protein
MQQFLYPGQILLADHQRIDQLLGQVLQVLDTTSPDALSSSGRFRSYDDGGPQSQRDPTLKLRNLWMEIEEGLTNHMATEEALLFTAFRTADMREAMVLQAEHQHIRASLTELTAGVVTRPELIRRFLQDLTSHSRREDALLYRWSNQYVPPQTTEAIRTRLQRTFKELGNTVVTM